jgi:hypothetical protein
MFHKKSNKTMKRERFDAIPFDRAVDAAVVAEM